MSIERRLKKLERQVRKTSVRFVIRTWEDRGEAENAIARELGYSSYRDTLKDLPDIRKFCRRYKELKEQGALIETAEFHRLEEEERRKEARRYVRYVHRRWKETLARTTLSEEERLQRAYCEAEKREKASAGIVLSTDEHLKFAWENMPEGQEMEQWLEEIEAEYPAEERKRWKEERRARIKAQISDSD